jgi:hypothetical protein
MAKGTTEGTNGTQKKGKQGNKRERARQERKNDEH